MLVDYDDDFFSVFGPAACSGLGLVFALYTAT